MKAEELVRQGDLGGALEALKDQVRKDPAAPAPRVFLFQLFSVLGLWDKALTQLNVASDLDPINLLMAQVCQHALRCEALREKVFAGERTPLVFGEPSEWMSLMIDACRLTGQGHHAKAEEVRARAFETAPAVAGKIDDKPFEWIADADTRLGPIAEAIIEGRYYWIPFSNIHRMTLEAPSDLRDVVWIPAELQWTNGGTAVALLPVRYPGSHASDDDGVRLARKTEWVEAAPDCFLGLGQRMWATDTGEFAMLETREITLDNAAFEPEPSEGDGG